MINSKSLTIPKHILEDKHLSAMDVLCYCRLKNCFDTRKEWKNYPTTLLCVDTKIEWGEFSQSLRNLEARGFISLDRDSKTVSIAEYTHLYPRGGRGRSLYFGRYSDGVCKVGITDDPGRREKQLSQYGLVFHMELVYSFEQGGLAGHLERMIKNGIPMLKQQIPGGTECFEEKHLEHAIKMVDGFIESVFCGEVTVVKKEREVGGL